MILAYHAIFTSYGTWLPNDPRGSYSKTIYQNALTELGEIHYGRKSTQPRRSALLRFQRLGEERLARPAFYIREKMRPIIAGGFAKVIQRLNLTVPACAVMDDHIHLLVLRSKYTIEYLVNQFKGAATLSLQMAATPWTRGCWKVFLDDEEAIEACIEYIEANPQKARLKPQTWAFVCSRDKAWRYIQGE